MKKEEYPTVTCRHCGKTEEACYVEERKKSMVDNNHCFSCDFWMDLVKRHARDENCVAVSKDSTGLRPFSHVTIGPETTSPHAFRGFGGSKFEIEFADGTKRVTTNLWHQGEIPERFRYLFTRWAKVS